MLRMMKVLAATAGAAALLAVGALPASASTTTATDRGYTKVTIAPSTLAALTSLGVSPGLVAPATVSKASPLSVHFPMVGYGSKKTVIKHVGGITLTAGATTVTITDLTSTWPAAASPVTWPASAGSTCSRSVPP